MSHPLRKPLVALLACVTLLLAQGWFGAASAAEWPTWPRPKAPATETAPAPETPAAPQAPAPETAPPAPGAAAKAGETAGKKTAGGIKAGTIAWGALIAAGVAGIAIAVFGGSSSSNH